MVKTKTRQSRKPDKYVSPWAITPKNADYYRKSYHRPGGAPPLDFTKLKTESARIPGMGSGWKTKSELSDERKEFKNGK